MMYIVKETKIGVFPPLTVCFTDTIVEIAMHQKDQFHSLDAVVMLTTAVHRANMFQ